MARVPEAIVSRAASALGRAVSRGAAARLSTMVLVFALAVVPATTNAQVVVGDSLWRLGRTDEAEPGCVIVNRIIPGSPADMAGLRINDRIDRIGGRPSVHLGPGPFSGNHSNLLRMIQDVRSPLRGNANDSRKD